MDDGTRGMPQVRVVEGGRGVGWWADAWAHFMKNPGLWVVFGVIVALIFGLLGFVPFIGGLVSSLLAPVFIGGWLLAARKVDNGGTLEIGDLFAGFKEPLQPLVILGALLLAAVIVIGLACDASSRKNGMADPRELITFP